MISSPLGYLAVITLLATLFYQLEKKSGWRLFEYFPGIVLIYIYAMVLSSLNIIEQNEAISSVYKTTKNNLLPAMLFLMLLSVDIKQFLRLGRKLLIAFSGAVISMMIAFITVFYLFSFNLDESTLFGALSGSWMGGTANMIAIASALGTSENMMGYALVVDAVDYTLWVMFLLVIVKFAKKFNSWSRAEEVQTNQTLELGCACTIETKEYYKLIGLSLLVAFFSNIVSTKLPFLSSTTWLVLIATVLGIIGSFTPLRRLNGSVQVGSTMLYLLVALIGSRASLEGIDSVPTYIFAGILILVIHGVLMAILAKVFKLDLFSISVASLSCVGGVASAPILAATYDKSLVAIAVLMAIAGYLVGTFSGLLVGNILKLIA
ncbi:MAG: DUF819 family protein [Helicobacteraceae bacterium]|nr:DUF819 family protein [Helicobacteraceae bacterium]